MSLTIAADATLASGEAELLRHPSARQSAARALRDMEAILVGDGAPLGRLIALAVTGRDPSVDAFLARLRVEDPTALLLRLAGFEDRPVEWQTAMREAARGNRAMLARMVRSPSASDADQTLVRLFDIDASEVAARVLATTCAWAETGWPLLAADALPALANEAARARAMLGDADIDSFTNGVEWTSWPDRVVRAALYPTVVGQPWVTHMVVGSDLVVVYPLRVDTAARRAREWERLRELVQRRDFAAIVQTLKTDARTIDELARDLGTDPGSLRALLVNLRSAGFVSVDAASHKYRLRMDGPISLGRLLDGFGRSPTPASASRRRAH